MLAFIACTRTLARAKYTNKPKSFFSCRRAPLLHCMRQCWARQNTAAQRTPPPNKKKTWPPRCARNCRGRRTRRCKHTHRASTPLPKLLYHAAATSPASGKAFGTCICSMGKLRRRGCPHRAVLWCAGCRCAMLPQNATSKPLATAWQCTSRERLASRCWHASQLLLAEANKSSKHRCSTGWTRFSKPSNASSVVFSKASP